MSTFIWVIRRIFLKVFRNSDLLCMTVHSLCFIRLSRIVAKQAAVEDKVAGIDP
jgi:hypothetical protein